MKNKTTIFIPGLSERKKDYKNHPISKEMEVFDVDWNVCKLPKKGYTHVVGFSFGGIIALEYAIKYPVDTLILCSMTPMIGSTDLIKKIKAKKVILMVGDKEPYKLDILENYRKLSHKLKDTWTICVVPKATHKIGKEYLNTIFAHLP